MNYSTTDNIKVDAVVNKHDNASVYLDNAETTIKFLVDIPTVLSKYIFCCITAEAYDIAAFYSIDEIKDQFITVVLESCYKKRQTYIKEIWKKLTSSNRLKENTNKSDFNQELINNGPWLDLPSLQSLNDCFDYFDVSEIDDVNWDLNSFPLGQRLKNTLINNGIDNYLENDMFLETDNCFQKIGYKTQYINICNNDTDKYDKLFFRWYCMGEVLDIVLETIFNNRNTQLTKSLFHHLMNACKNQNELAKLVQTRYDQMKLYRPGLKDITFYEEKSEPVCVQAAFVEVVEDEPLPRGIGEIEHYSEDDYQRLYQSMLKLGLLRPISQEEKYGNSYEDFRSLFSDGKIINRLYWHGIAYELSYFVERISIFNSGKFDTETKFNKRIMQCFKIINKNSKGEINVKDVPSTTLRTSKNNTSFEIKIKVNNATKEIINKDSDNITEEVCYKDIELLKLNFSALIYNQKQRGILKEAKDNCLHPYQIEFMDNEHLPMKLSLLKEKRNEYKNN